MSLQQSLIARLALLMAIAASTIARADVQLADHHLWEFTEIFTNADGAIQFIEMHDDSSGEQFTQGTTIRASQGATVRNFTFPANAPTPTGNRNMLLATSGFAALPGAPTPNFIIPDGFLFAPNGTLQYLTAAGFANYTNLPTDGVNSLNYPGGTIAANTPTNHAGTTATIYAGTPIDDPLPAVPKGTLNIELQVVASGLIAPLGLAAPDDDSDRLFIYDQAGRVSVIENGQALATPFLDVSARLVALGIGGPGSYDERGLLGFAPHPNFAANPRVYTYTSEPIAGSADFTNSASTQDHQSVIAEWTLTSAGAAANTVDLSSRREILRIDQPQFNHNGGSLHFGPDGFLYISLGDGGEADDQGDGHVAGGNAQDITNIYGTLLRIDVDQTVGAPSANGDYNLPPDNPFVGEAGLDEIYVYGLRNPYAFSFDMGNFDTSNFQIFIGDAGQNFIEEVDRVTAANVGGNYGWPFKEGSFFFDQNGDDPGRVVTAPPNPIPDGLIDPVAEYDHGNGIENDNGSVVVAGFVYRGSAIPELSGVYVCGDFGPSFSQPTGRLWYLDPQNNVLEFIIGEDDRPLGLYLKGFGQDADGEIYVCGSQDVGPFGTSGVVLKIIPIPLPNSAAAGWSAYP